MCPSSRPGSTPPNASNLNFVAGQTIPNMVFVPVDASGRVQLRNGSTGTLDLIADTAGYIRRADDVPPPSTDPTVRLIGEATDHPSMPSISDDGGVVTYLDSDEDGSRTSVRVWTRSDNQTRTIATGTDGAFVDQPQVVGDSSEVYFSAGDGAATAVTIKRWDLATGQTATVHTFEGYRFLVSRDGTRLAHDLFRDDGDQDIVLVDLAGGADQLVTPSSGYANLASVASNGAFVGYDNYTESSSGVGTQVARVWADSSNTSTVVGPADLSGTTAVVSDDGASAVWLNGDSGRLYRWVKGGTNNPISPDGFNASYPSMGADGRVIAFESTDFASLTGIRLIEPAVAGTPYVVGGDASPDTPTQPDLSFDGKWMAFVTTDGTGLRVAVRGPFPGPS